MTVSWSDLKDHSRATQMECRGGPWDGEWVNGRTIETSNVALVSRFDGFYAAMYQTPEWFWLWCVTPEYVRMEGQ